MIVRRRSLEDYAIDSVVWLMMILVFVATFYPFYLAFILSLNDGIDAQKGGIYFLPRVFTLDNYNKFFTDIRWMKAFLVTLARTVLGTGVTVLVTTLVAYGLSFKKLVGRKVYIKIVIFSMYFSGGIIPFYVVLRSLKLLDNFLVYIIPGCLNLFFALVAISFFEGIPMELHESALIDGANDIRVFISIIMPISMPLLATIAIFTAVGHWNSWFDSAFFIQNNDMRTLGYLMISVINKASMPSNSEAMQAVGTVRTTSLSVQLAAMIISVAPIIVIYPFMQKYFISGLTIGSVKG